SLPSISLMIQPRPSTMMRLPSWLAASARQDEAWIQTCSLPAWSKSVGSSGTLENVWGNVAIGPYSFVSIHAPLHAWGARIIQDYHRPIQLVSIHTAPR